jgi:hypothetical protein
MKYNFINSFLGQMMSENGKPSSKRWSAAITCATLQWVIVYTTLKATNSTERMAVIWATISFILVLLGFATLPQIIALVRGGNIPKEDTSKEEQPKQD